MGRCYDAPVIIKTGNGLNLSAIDPAWVQAAIRSDGCVLFRGYNTKPEAFDVLARKLTKTHFVGYGRQIFPELPAITSANEQMIALAPHSDNALRPEAQRPELTWFWSVKPAESGGDGLFYDGVRVWLTLADQTRKVLSERKVRFVSRYHWRDLRYSDRASFERFIATIGGTVREYFDDDSADVEVLQAPVRRTRWGNELAFVSSVCIAGSDGFEGMRVTLEGEDKFPAELRADIDRALALCCQTLTWEIGDILVLDNTRFLHGRTKHADPFRRMYLIQTLRANFE